MKATRTPSPIATSGLNRNPTPASTGAAPGPQSPGGGSIPRIAIASAAITALGVLATAGSGAGYRMGTWGLEPAFRMFAVGAAVALLGGLVALMTLAVPSLRRRRGVVPVGVTTVLVAAVTATTFATWYTNAQTAAPIHDITTDVTDPPAFVALRPQREVAPNGLTYGGDSIAKQQLAAYPDIKPVRLPVAPSEAFRRSVIVARSMGWDPVKTDSNTLRIEATATTPWYGFKDDIVIRVRPVEGGSQVDVRSASRLGESDVGTNAARIRRFVARLKGA